MRIASVGDIQHNLSAYLRYIEQGEEIRVTKHNKEIAKIVPLGDDDTTVLPDFAQRAMEMFPDPKGKLPSELIQEDRSGNR